MDSLPNPQPADWIDATKVWPEVETWHVQRKAVQCQHILMPVTGTNESILDFASCCLLLSENLCLLYHLMDSLMELLFPGAESYYAAVGNLMDLNYAIGDDIAQRTAPGCHYDLTVPILNFRKDSIRKSDQPAIFKRSQCGDFPAPRQVHASKLPGASAIIGEH